jgi:hypothetical protein
VKQKSNRFSSSSNEVRNRYEFLRHVLSAGFVPFIPEYDPGVDVILYRERDDLLLKVQLKSRFTISRKYFQRNIWMAFPDNELSREIWFLAPHDVLYQRGQVRVFEKGRSKGNPVGHLWHKGFSSNYVTAELRAICVGFEVPAILETLTAERAILLQETGAREW